MFMRMIFTMKSEVLTENVRIELPMGNLGLAVTQPAGGSNTTQHSTTTKHCSNTTQTRRRTAHAQTWHRLSEFEWGLPRDTRPRGDPGVHIWVLTHSNFYLISNHKKPKWVCFLFPITGTGKNFRNLLTIDIQLNYILKFFLLNVCFIKTDTHLLLFTFKCNRLLSFLSITF